MVNTKTILLIGSSVDGKVTLSTGVSSKEFGKMLTAQMGKPINTLREWADAIIVSRSTVETDNPSLVSQTNPNLVRVILDRSFRLSPDKNVFRPPQKTLLITTKLFSSSQKKLFGENVEIICLNKKGFLTNVKTELLSRGLHKLLVEGGGAFNDVLISEKWVDELVIAYFPFLVGGKLTPTVLDGNQRASITDAILLKLISSELIDKQMLVAHYELMYK